jgi:hypothetical protein
VDDEVPNGGIDGNNRSFQLQNLPTAGSVKVWLNGIRMHAPEDYAISGRVIIFAIGVTPQAGDILFVEYRY